MTLFPEPAIERISKKGPLARVEKRGEGMYVFHKSTAMD